MTDKNKITVILDHKGATMSSSISEVDHRGFASLFYKNYSYRSQGTNYSFLLKDCKVLNLFIPNTKGFEDYDDLAWETAEKIATQKTFEYIFRNPLLPYEDTDNEQGQ